VTLLEEKRSQLRTLEAQLAALHQKLKEANEQKQQLEDNVSVCSNKLMRAEKLIGKMTGSRLLSPQS
jgi:dynein heavy chain